VILPGEGKAHERPDLLPLPDNLRMERDISALHFRYRHPSWKGLLWLVIGVIFFGAGWLFFNPGESFIEKATMSIFILLGGGDWEYVSDQVSYTIVGVILSFFGVTMLYLGIAVLIDKLTIRVAHHELRARQTPLPYQRARRMQSKELEQLYITQREVNARMGRLPYAVLEAVLRDNRRIPLAVDLPYNVLHYLEVQIESWLGLKDRRVVGEILKEELKKEYPELKHGRLSPITAPVVAVGTLILPGFCLSVGIFIYLLELPWCPPELAQDSGLGEAFAIPGILYFPCAAILSGLLGFVLFRISHSLLKNANPLALAIISGVLSGLFFAILYPVVLTMLLCMV